MTVSSLPLVVAVAVVVDTGEIVEDTGGSAAASAARTAVGENVAVTVAASEEASAAGVVSGGVERADAVIGEEEREGTDLAGVVVVVVRSHLIAAFHD